MDRRALAAVALAVLAVVAGCSSGGSGTPTATPADGIDGQTPTATPMPQTDTPDDSNGTGPFANVTFPPGLSADGVTEPGLLLDAHARTLSGQDFVGQYNSTTVLRTANDSQRGRELGGIRVDSDTERYVATYLLESPDGNLTQIDNFGNDSTVVTRRTTRNGTTYESRQANGTFRNGTVTFALQPVYDVLDSGSFNAVNTTVDDGRTFVTYNLTSISSEGFLGRNFSGTGLTDGAMVVDDRGVIRQLSVGARVTNNNQTRSVSRVFVFSAGTGDTSVTPPPWVSRVE